VNVRHKSAERARGLTLMELLASVAIIGILVVLVYPTYTAYFARGRVSGAAEALAQDLNLARSESIRRNGDVTMSFSPGGTWCYGSVAGSTACSCTTPGSCTLRQVAGSAYAGVSMAMGTPPFVGNATVFMPFRAMGDAGAVVFTHESGPSLRVSLGAAGQVSICTVSGGLTSYPSC
jgi:type IV fimbrial biogenesis protein FimT